MKKFILSAAFFIAALTMNAQYFPQPSPLARNYQMVGLTEMEIEFSRPGVKDRVIFGDLVPYGKLWRTGANSATKISFTNDVMFAGKPVEAGTYALFTIPNEKEVTIMLNSNANQGGTGSYSDSLDVVTVTVPFQTTDKNVERMRFAFENVDDDKVDLVFNWSNRSFTVPISVNTAEIAEANLEGKLKEINDLYAFYEDAASYYLAENKDPKQALEWAKMSVDMQERFWNVHTLAKAYKANGDKEMALKTAQRSLQLAQEANYPPYVKMNEKLIAELK